MTNVYFSLNGLDSFYLIFSFSFMIYIVHLRSYDLDRLYSFEISQLIDLLAFYVWPDLFLPVLEVILPHILLNIAYAPQLCFSLENRKNNFGVFASISLLLFFSCGSNLISSFFILKMSIWNDQFIVAQCSID